MLPSKYAPGGISKADSSRLITLGKRRGSSTFVERLSVPPDGDIEMTSIDDDEDVNAISQYVRSSRGEEEFTALAGVQDTSLLGPHPQIPRETSTESFLVVDTNFVVSHLDVVAQLLELAPQYGHTLVVPLTVVRELDGLKKSDRGDLGESIGHLARWANNWIYSALADNKAGLVAQTGEQRLDRQAEKDDSILDCCLYWQKHNPRALVVLLSNDKNFCLRALSHKVLTVSYRKGMTAELIARVVRNEGRGSDSMDWEKRETSMDTFSQIQALLVSVVRRCMESGYGDSLELVRGYDPAQVVTVADCAQVIVRFWQPVFSDYFRDAKCLPFEEKREGKRVVRSVVHVVPDKEFVGFWSGVLERLYGGEMDREQNEALGVLKRRWMCFE